MTRLHSTCVLSIWALLLISCGGGDVSNTASTANTIAAPSCEAGGDTPTQAYKRLFEAVKSKQTENIKAQVSENTIQLASFISAQNKTPLDKVFENGFVSSTFSPTLPDIRDERINCNMGAIEVWNSSQQKWEETAFIIEEGRWKLAVGDLMRGNYKQPGTGLATREAEAANAARGNTLPTPPAFNSNRPKIAPLPANSANSPRKP